MRSYYSDRHLEQIKKSNGYHELLLVAIDVLQFMHEVNLDKPIAMLCGPISTGGIGSRQENLKIFNRAIERAADSGLLVFSQMPFEDDMVRIFNSDPSLQGLTLLEQFYMPIFEWGLINLLCFLPGWEKSVGANWEHNQAKRLKIPVIYLSDVYTKE